MIRYAIAFVVLALLALTTDQQVSVDGVTKAKALGMIRLDIGGRRLALAVTEYRPGRCYYRLAAGSVTA